MLFSKAWQERRGEFIGKLSGVTRDLGCGEIMAAAVAIHKGKGRSDDIWLLLYADTQKQIQFPTKKCLPMPFYGPRVTNLTLNEPALATKEEGT